MEENAAEGGEDESGGSSSGSESGSSDDEGEGDQEGSEKGDGDAEGEATEQAQSADSDETKVETQPTAATPEPVVVQPATSQVEIAKEPTPPPPPPPAPKPEPEPVVEEVEEEEKMEPEVVPDFLKNVDWEPAKPEDFELFEYEPLVEPIRRMSELEIVSEVERDNQWATDRRENRPPLILTHLSDRAAPAGSTLKLTLAADGPGVVVTWFRDGEPLEKNNRYTQSVNCGLYTLTITELNRKDRGLYTAQVKNRLDTLETSAKVTILSLPKEKKVKPLIVKIRGE